MGQRSTGIATLRPLWLAACRRPQPAATPAIPSPTCQTAGSGSYALSAFTSLTSPSRGVIIISFSSPSRSRTAREVKPLPLEQGRGKKRATPHSYIYPQGGRAVGWTTASVWRCRSVGSSSSLLHSLGPEPAAGQFLEGDQSRGGGGGGASERARSKKAGEMAGGGMAALGVNTERAAQYKGRMTLAVAMTCLVAAVGGAIFGYDIGISGGVTSMDPFLKKFFPAVYHRKNSGSQNNYCKYDNQGLAAFTSSLYLAGLVSSLAASPVTRNYGRKASIVCGGISFLVGATLNVAAVNLAMLILGRIMLGVGIGFGNQAVPLYLSEMAPAHLRGGLNMMFQLATTLGIFTANLINYGTQNIKPWGWRLSLGLAAAPAVLMTLGGLLLPETPNSLIERGRVEEGRRVLERIRGTEDVDAEFTDMVEASELANTIEHPFRNILERRNRPQLVMAVCMPAFQILTGINSILFYAPVLFQSMGFGGNASLYSSVLTGAVLFSSTLISIGTVDRLGRRKLLISGGIQMIVCQVIVAVILGVKFGVDKQLSRSYSIAVVVVICLFVLAFGWSWGPLGWTVPSEIFPLETRSAGQSITVAVNLLFTFAIAQAFLSLLCAFKFGIFLFFAGWITVMTVFVSVFLPETKGVPIEEMVLLWRKHWFWKKVMPDMPLEDGWGAAEGHAVPANNSHK